MTNKADIAFARLVVDMATVSRRRNWFDNIFTVGGPFIFGMFGFQALWAFGPINTWCPWWLALPISLFGACTALIAFTDRRRYIKAAHFYGQTMVNYMREHGTRFIDE